MKRPPQSEAGVRALQKEATAQAVLDAAREEFERAGFEAANVRAIAARARVSPGTVIHHYGDKRELLHAALYDDLGKTLRRALANLGPPPLERQLAALTRAVFRYYERRPKLSRTLLAHSLFAEGEWGRKFTEQVAGVHAVIARLASEARDRDELRADADGALLAVAYFSFFYFALIAWVQGAHAAPIGLVEALVREHLAGLRPRKPAHRGKAR